ncbi:MMPL family transporter, partial [Vibrio diabolicus]
IRLLQTMPNDLKQQETLITTLSGMQSSQQMLVITADDDENLMKKLESLTPTLEAWKADSTIESYQSLSRYLSSVERQQQDYQLIR